MKKPFVPDEYAHIVKLILPTVIELAEERDGLVADEETCRIIYYCLGTGFSLGMAYNQTDKTKPWELRVYEALEIVKSGKLNS